MSNMYYQKVNGAFKDFYDLCEAQQYTAAPWGTSFTGDSARQKAGSNTTNVTMPNFLVDNTAITAVKKGYMPTPKMFGEFTVPGSYTLTRNETAISVTGPNGYSGSIPAANWRGGKVPHEIIIFVAGGGGGGGGNGWWSPGKDKSGYARICGAAGGGGGYAVGRLVLVDNRTYNFTVGKGGSVGSDGASDDNSKGSTGGSGGTSSFVSAAAQDWYVSATGGSGGTGGDGTGSKAEKLVAGTGGSGGTGSKNVSYGSTGSGGAGNHLQSHSRTSTAGMSFTTTAGTGAPNTTFVSAKNNDGDVYVGGVKQNHDDLEGNGSYFCGGCSVGYGAFPAYSSAYIGIGGGGGGGSLNTDGAPGCVFLYY